MAKRKKILNDADVERLFSKMNKAKTLSETEVKNILSKIIFNLIKDNSDSELELKTKYFSDDLRDASKNPKHFSVESLLSIAEDVSILSKLNQKARQ